MSLVKMVSFSRGGGVLGEEKKLFITVKNFFLKMEDTP